MKKIPTLFKREFKDHKVVKILPEFTDDKCKDAVINGEATIKFDGSCCAVIDGKFYKRYDAKKGKPIPENAIKCQEEADPVTGHLPCWVPVDEKDPADKWFVEAYINKTQSGEVILNNRTYEAIGPHFQGNPYELSKDTLARHGYMTDDFEIPSRDPEEILKYIHRYLVLYDIEGLVFWRKGEPVCKIKRTDFGLPWPSK